MSPSPADTPAPPAPPFALLSAQEHVEDCVHCGLCLEACPTYALWGTEADSPRGRITQIGDALADGGRVSAEMAGHIDTCLGDMACVSACPAGVAYDRLLAEARPAVEQQHPRSPGERALRLLLLETLPYPDRLQALLPALGAARRFGRRRRIPGRIATLARLMPPVPGPRELAAPIPAFTPARGRRRGEVGLLLGCVQRVFFSDLHRASIGVLTAEGFDVHAPQLPDCCGALELAAGEEEHAAARAQATVAAFTALGDLDAVIANTAGCGAAMKDYGAWLRDDAAWAFAGRVRDITEFLAEHPPLAPRGRLDLGVVVHDPCHLRHSQGVTDAPAGLLATVPGLRQLTVPAGADHCCGAPGIYAATQPETAAALGRQAAERLLAAGADTIATANPACAVQLARHCGELGRPLAVTHPVELLWRSLQAR